jgi:MFS transporter, OFA family, oxalate/formate antiporter
MRKSDFPGINASKPVPLLGKSRSSDIALVIVAFLGGFAVWPAFAALGSLFDTLNGQFGWSRSQVTTAQLIFTVVSVATAPIIGPLIDRLGVRTLLLPGLVLFPMALVVVGSVDRSYEHWVGAWIAASIAGQLVASPVFAAGVARRFKSHRGIALGFAACGVAAATAIIPLIMVRLVALGAWRDFYYGLAGFLIFIVLPLTFLFYRDDNCSSEDRSTSANIAPNIGKSIKGFRSEVLASRQYWQLLTVVFLVSFVVGGMLIHMQPLFRSHGLSAALAASAAAFYGIGGIVGRLIGGWLLDRYAAGPLPALPMCIFPAIASLIVLIGQSATTAAYAIVALMIGISAGVEVDVVPYLVRRYFSAKFFGRTYLSLAAVFVAGAGASPFLVSLAYDATKSYEVFLVGSIVMGFAAGILLLLLGSYPNNDHQPGKLRI